MSRTRLPSALVCLLCLPPLIASVAFSAQAPPLKNPGFEEELAGWHPLPVPEETNIAADQEKARSGHSSVKLEAPEGVNPWLAQGVPDILPRATYAVQVWAAHGEGPARAALKLEFYDAENQYLAGFYALEPEAPTAEWTPVRVQAEAPENAAKAAVILRMLGAGTLFFDDASFTLVAPPPPVTLSPARLAVPAQAGAKVTLAAELGLDVKLTGDPQAVLIGSAAERPVAVPVKVGPGTARAQMTLEATLPQVPPGAYKLQVRWGELTPAVMSLVLLPSGQRPANLDAQGRFRQGDETLFPVGLYHVNPEDFAEVAQAGFGVVEIPPPTSAEDLKATVQAAQEAGLLLLVPLYPALDNEEKAAALVAMVEQFSEEPAIFAWLLADQPELRAGAGETIADLYLRLRQADAHHPVMLTVGPQADVSAWAPLCDALVLQAFPKPEDSPTALPERIARAAGAVRETQPWLALLAAGWPGQESPSPEQARAWVYRAIAAGASGVLWFSLREGTWSLTATPLWTELPQLNAETAELAAAFRQGENWGDLEVSVEKVAAFAIKHGEQAYLLLFNESPNPLAGAVRLPGVVTEAEYLDTGEEAPARSHTVRFELRPNAARALRLTLAPVLQPPTETQPAGAPTEEAGP